MASEYTANYNLDKYTGEDKPNLRDQYNSAMDKIDSALKTNADTITNANASIITINGALTNLQEQYETDHETLETLSAETVPGLTTKINTLESGLSTVETEIDGYDSRITVVESGLSDAADQIDTLQSSISNLESSRAPTNHASAATTYGVGTGSNYGHLRLYDSHNSSYSTSSGYAMTPYGGSRLYYQNAFLRVRASSDTSIPSGGAITNIPLTSTGQSSFYRQSDTAPFVVSGTCVRCNFTGQALVWASVYFNSSGYSDSSSVGCYLYQGTSNSFSAASEIAGCMGNMSTPSTAPKFVDVTEDTYFFLAGRNLDSSTAKTIDSDGVSTYVCFMKIQPAD